jgi:hypothetical protein
MDQKREAAGFFLNSDPYLQYILRARIIHELATATVDMNVFPGVLGP